MTTTDTAAFIAASTRLDLATAAAVAGGVPLEEDFGVTEAQTTILNLLDQEAESRAVGRAA